MGLLRLPVRLNERLNEFQVRKLEQYVKYLLLATVVFITACSDNEVDPLEGEFIFGPTENLSYEARSFRGLTDETGLYLYAEDEDISFSFGDIQFGSTLASEKISPSDFTSDSQHPDTLLNIMRFLLTLDTDGTEGGSITLPDPESVFSRVTSIDFDQSSADFAKDVNMLNYLNAAVKKIDLVDSQVALDSFEAALETHGLNVDTDGDGAYDFLDAFPNDASETQDTDNDGIGNNADTDDDGDGIDDVNDTLPLGGSSDIDSDEDGVSDDIDADVDGDTIENAADNCPLLANSDQSDADGDGVGDACDSDADGDGIEDSIDNCPVNANADQADSDLDQIGDVCDLDVDGDKVIDSSDNCPAIYNPQQIDLDSDGSGDLCDNDKDGDALLDTEDNCPLVVNKDQLDRDNDTYGDVCDLDIDGDSLRNAVDNCPLISNVDQADLDNDQIGDVCDLDTDGDGVNDDTDNCPVDANSEQQDLDLDGVGDACDSDIDGDGYANTIDDFPTDNSEWLDTDGDGVGNNTDEDDDDDGFLDTDDALPLDENEHEDNDGDGVGDIADTDDDNDGVLDAVDAFPFDDTESLDTDRDGIGNNADTDDDNDGYLDDDDDLPLDGSEHIDTDGDGIGNNADTDDDNDGVTDSDDAFPLDPLETIDTDLDGVGNNADTDDDNDGYLDEDDDFPLDSGEYLDTDGDGIGNNTDTDDDGDGVLDPDDAFPLDASESSDTDGDGIGDNSDPDADVPHPVADSFTVDSGSTGNSFSILGNDSFGLDGVGTVAVAISIAPANGSAIVNDNGTPSDPMDDTIEYDSNGSFSGTDTITYDLTDASGSVGSAVISIKVDPVITSFTVDNTSDPKVLRFNWDGNGIGDVDHFYLLENRDGASGFSIVSSVGSLTPASRSVDLESALHLLDWDNAQYRIEARDESEIVLAGANLLLSSLATDGSFEHPSNDPIGMFKASNNGEGDAFGTRVVVSSDGLTMAVSAPFEDSNATGVNGDQANEDAGNSGAVYVYTKAGSTWSQHAYLKASNTGSTDLFGASLAISSDGDTLVIGATDEQNSATGVEPGTDDSGADNSGAVYVFTRSSNTWTQQAYIKASNTGSSDEFGTSLSLSNDGNTLVVGALGESSDATGVNGDEANNDEANSGAAYVFTRSGSTWTQHSYLKASNTESGDRFGSAVAISGDGLTLSIGASNESSDSNGVDGDQANNDAGLSGAVYVFTFDGANWSQQSYLKAANSDASDMFGNVVALSDDGDTLVIGALQEASSAEGINGDQTNNDSSNSGAVFVFERSSGAWSQTNYLKSHSTDEQYFGTTVSMSSDARYIAVGSTQEQNGSVGVNGFGVTGNIPSGASYVFVEESGTWSQRSYVRSPIPRSNERCGEALDMSSDASVLAVGCMGQQSDASGITTDNALGGDAVVDSGAVFLY